MEGQSNATSYPGDKCVTEQVQSGAAQWTTSQRQAFANDLNNPQLFAVTDNVNQAKGDAGPEEWKPPLGKF
jgi:hypothetical protein